MLIANKNFRFISLFLTVVLMLAGVTFLQLASSAPAHASEATCASSGNCQDISTNVALQNSGASGGALGGKPVGGGGGGSASPPAVPWNCDPNDASKCAPTYVTRATFFPISGGRLIACPTKIINGVKVDVVGNTIVEISYLVGFGNTYASDGAYWTGYQFLTTICNYPPDPTNVSTNIKCILSYTANIDRLSNSYLGYGGRIDSKSQTLSSLASLESDPSGCQKSMNASFGTNIGRSQAEYGWYKATSSVAWASCDFGTITFNGVSTRKGGCRDAGTLNGSVGKLTIYCGPAIKGWVQLDWTGKDCYGSGPTCSVPNTSKFNGYMGNVQALRDGNDNTMAWANPVFTAGISGAGNWRTKTDVNAGSTPFKNGVGVNDKANQMFRSNQSFGTWNGGSLTALQNQKLAFYTSGSTGSPFSMTRNYLFDANFTTVATRITGYNITTGAMSTGNSSTTVYLRNNPCGPQSSPSINAVRAIGDVLTE